MFYEILSVSLSMSVIILIVLFCSHFLNKRYTAKWRYFVWLFIALRLAIPINFSLPQAPVKFEVPIPSTLLSNEVKVVKDSGGGLNQDFTGADASNNDLAVKLPVLDNASDKDYHKGYNKDYNNDFSKDYKEVISEGIPSDENIRSVSLQDMLVIIWAVGAISFFLYHIIVYMVFRKRIQKWCSVFDTSIKQRVMVCKKIKSPMLVGFIKPVILIPDIEYSDNEFSVILSHEMVHYKRGDLWYKLLLVIANSIHWFNPFVYVLVRSANFDLELTCDDIVVRNKDLGFRKAYSTTILNSIRNENSTAFSTYFVGSKESLKKRFSNILDVNIKKKGILAVIAMLICILSVGCLFTVQKNPEVSPEGQKNPEGTPVVHENSKVNTKADTFELTQEKLGSLANSIIGSDMATLVYADEKRVIFHYSYALIVYDLESRKIYRMLDLEKLNIPLGVQGGEVIDVCVNYEGTEVFIGAIPHREKAYIYNIEKSTVEETAPEYTGRRFEGLRDTTELYNKGYDFAGWNSICYVKMDNSICYLLLTKTKVGSIKIIIEDEKHKKEEYTIFENTSITEETAIVLKDTPLFADLEGLEKAADLKKNDFVYVIYDQNIDLYYVQTYDVKGDIPDYGYINKKLISFDLPKGQSGNVEIPGKLVIHDTELGYSNLQREVDNGKYPWMLDAKQTALNYINNLLMNKEVEITAYSDDGKRASVTCKKDDGTKLTINLTKPVKKDKTGIWIASHDTLSGMKIDLATYPVDYNIETATKDGMAVFVDSKLNSGKEVIEAFFNKSSKGIACDLSICHKSDGGIYLTRIMYDGELFYGVEDYTRYNSDDENYYEFTYKYLKVFEEKNMKSVYLVNDADVTYEQLFKSMASSSTKDFISNRFLLYYEK